ncbi:Asp23/Gls24 family envelope stress response protein [Pediococcus claussenii]|uniref:Asp23/Gls24 family envelope stress response protein n=1 Tax=Pediococcus claussenii (strain ATCC BAA-344 / DSM 14800 / JCM 18046 / KCTC 3811 / LMG 21948 / P06) TaxID=701521 RepID=G8PDJ8_PEDCP|nr:Asp23/Gls24 family envelope stress response protein [Pediococcus claussenii]AEV95333.1 hypothetical protein PECL_1065 [Pediococcus claussenii ATCC BAA-344]ANZ68865.1 hypothetical protein AYR57_00370 [Pediococcus claussenii]ANZ70681.1 hypothetical protein AYR58_00370 [Pediococcus claussenii]KRN19485.1 hypothetical protein IV79_GL001202 [Pediococcus claussenii]
MAESKFLELTDTSSSNGNISITPEVVEAIAGLEVEQIKGVHLVDSGISKSFNAILRLDSNPKGVRLSEDDRGLVIDIRVMLDFGISVPQTAAQIQEKIKQQLLFMTEIVINEVNVEIVGMEPEEVKSDINPDDIFAENDGEDK